MSFQVHGKSEGWRNALLLKASKLRYKDPSWGNTLSEFCLRQQQDKAGALYIVPSTGGPTIVVYLQMGTHILWSNLHSNCISLYGAAEPPNSFIPCFPNSVF